MLDVAGLLRGVVAALLAMSAVTRHARSAAALGCLGLRDALPRSHADLADALTTACRSAVLDGGSCHGEKLLVARDGWDEMWAESLPAIPRGSQVQTVP